MVGTLFLEIFLPTSTSLKAKRAVLNRIKGRIRRRFNASMAELDHQDLWQRSSIGFAVVGSDHGTVKDALEKIVRFVETQDSVDILKYDIEIL